MEGVDLSPVSKRQPPGSSVLTWILGGSAFWGVRYPHPRSLKMVKVNAWVGRV